MSKVALLHPALTHPGIAIGLAAVAAVCFAGAAVLQHRAVNAEHVPDSSRDPVTGDALSRSGLAAASATAASASSAYPPGTIT